MGPARRRVAFALYLNNDLIAEAGADDPRALAAAGEWDWAAFADVATKVSDLGGENKGFAMDAWWGPYGYFINAAGGSFFNEDRTECALDTPEAIAGVTQLAAVYDGGLAVPYGEDGDAPWKAGTVGMVMTGRWATPGARSDAPFNWDVVQLPVGPGGTQGNWLFWGAYVVNVDTENPQAAWDLVKALTEADTQATISELGANIPSRRSDAAIDAFLGFTPPENNQAFIDGLADSPTAEGPLWAGSWPEYDAAMGTAVGAVVNGDRTIDDYAANVCARDRGRVRAADHLDQPLNHRVGAEHQLGPDPTDPCTGSGRAHHRLSDLWGDSCRRPTPSTKPIDSSHSRTSPRGCPRSISRRAQTAVGLAPPRCRRQRDRDPARPPRWR